MNAGPGRNSAARMDFARDRTRQPDLYHSRC